MVAFFDVNELQMLSFLKNDSLEELRCDTFSSNNVFLLRSDTPNVSLCLKTSPLFYLNCSMCFGTRNYTNCSPSIKS